MSIENKDIIKWINEQPQWVQRAVWLYCDNGIIEDKYVKELADICVFEVNKQLTRNYAVEKINLVSRKNCDGFSVKSIMATQGVNAIDTCKPLKFESKGITVVYGNNGAGKSGYIRMFKMVSGAKYREDIKNNVYVGEKVIPKCEVVIEDENSHSETYKCDLTKPGEYEMLRNIDIFDTKISMAYVREAKEASYEPWIFGMFAALADTAVKVKNELESKKENIVAYKIPESLKDTELVKKLSEISYKSKKDDYIPKWKDDSSNKLKELNEKSQIKVNEAIISKLEVEIRAIDSLITYFSNFEEHFDEKEQNEINTLAKDLNQAIEEKKVVELLFYNNADDVEKESISNNAWITLWHSANEYYASLLKGKDELKYTMKGGKCPLCRQNINETVAEKMKKIDDYLNGQVANKECNCKKKLNDKLNEIPPLRNKENIEEIIKNADIQEELSQDISNLNNNLLLYKTLFTDGKYSELANYLNEIKKCVGLISTVKADKEKDMDERRRIIDNDEQVVIKKQIIELECEKCLYDNYETIKKNIDIMVHNNIIDKAIKMTATNKITSKSKEMAEEMITEEYVRRFNEELRILTGNTISVKLEQQKAGRGKTPYKVVLCDAKGEGISPQEILSEGENRVVSLAAFFAEAAGREESCPLIVDDPISSLDYDYEDKVIKRLVEAAKTRQVIVFTHRMSMCAGISDLANKDNSGVKHNEITIRASKKKKGVPYGSSSKGKVLGQLKDLKNNDVMKLMKMDELSSEYNEKLNYICQQFRIIVEKSIEDMLLNEVVKRFRRDVQTQRIKFLVNNSVEDYELMEKMMTKYSYYDHSMAEETPLVDFTAEEILEDVDIFLKWLEKRNKLKNR